MRRAIAMGAALAGWLMLWWYQPMAGGEYKGMHEGMPGAGTTGPPEDTGPIRIMAEELHRSGGIPKGWRFTLPPGDPEMGRHVFIYMACYLCHTVQGEEFSTTKKEPGNVGPDLTAVGAHHPIEYIAESILHPNAVIILGHGFTGSDGLSKMPSYNNTMTVRELLDLVAYLKNLTAEGGHTHH